MPSSGSHPNTRAGGRQREVLGDSEYGKSLDRNCPQATDDETQVGQGPWLQSYNLTAVQRSHIQRDGKNFGSLGVLHSPEISQLTRWLSLQEEMCPPLKRFLGPSFTERGMEAHRVKGNFISPGGREQT